MVTSDSRSCGRATCPRAIWSTTDTVWTDLGPKPIYTANEWQISCFPLLPTKNVDTVFSNASGSSHFYLFNPTLTTGPFICGNIKLTKKQRGKCT